MNKFTGGGKHSRREFVGGRPKSDINNYAPKKRFDKRDDRGSNERFNPKDRAPRPVELFQTTCTTCGKPCEVPFRPDGSKPVLCRDCFANKTKDGNPRPSNERSFPQARPAYRQEASVAKEKVDLAPLMNQIAKLDKSVSEILVLLKTLTERQSTAPAEAIKAPKKVTKKTADKNVVAKKAVTKKTAKKAEKKVATKKK